MTSICYSNCPEASDGQSLLASLNFLVVFLNLNRRSHVFAAVGKTRRILGALGRLRHMQSLDRQFAARHVTSHHAGRASNDLVAVVRLPDVFILTGDVTSALQYFARPKPSVRCFFLQVTIAAEKTIR
jgi:hypothetical protein